MTETTLTLPSRAQVTLRPVSLAHEGLLAKVLKDTRSNAQNAALERVIDACLVSMEDIGMYQIKEGKVPRAHDLLSGDRYAIMVELRCISRRNGHLYDLQDIECPGCSTFSVAVDLRTDLIRRDLSDEAFERLRDAKPHTVTVDGKRVEFVPMSGRTEELARQFMEEYPDRTMAALLRSRIVSVEGVERRDILEWLDGNNGESERYPGLSGIDADDLRAAMDEQECGIDTEVGLDCPACGSTQYVMLPFGVGFLVPSREILARKRSRRARHRRGKVASGS